MRVLKSDKEKSEKRNKWERSKMKIKEWPNRQKLAGINSGEQNSKATVSI